LSNRNVELALLDWGGNGPLALLTHAVGFCAATLSIVAEQLGSHYRVVAYDARGHGGSTKLPHPAHYEWCEFILDVVAVAETLVAELDLAKVALGIGHSFGGDCMLAAVARAPDLFEHIALLDPIVEPPVGERTGYYAGQGTHPLAEIARRRRSVFASREEVRQRLAERGAFIDWDPRVLQLYLEHGFGDLSDGRVSLQCPPEIEAAIYEAGPRFHIFSEIRQVRTKTTIYRALDGYSRRELVDRLAAGSEYVDVVAIEGGHLLPMTNPDVVVRRLLERDRPASLLHATLPRAPTPRGNPGS
jgi:pimeloyl-ACP methyl ester carboxylesterase